MPNNKNETTINLTPAAVKIVKDDVSAFNRDRLRYGKYVAEMSVTTDTVADHVAIFRNAFKVAKPKADGEMIKAYATKVRNGLNYHLGTVEKVTAVALRATLSGEGGGSVTIDMTSDLGLSILALIAEGKN